MFALSVAVLRRLLSTAFSNQPNQQHHCSAFTVGVVAAVRTLTPSMGLRCRRILTSNLERSADDTPSTCC